MPRYRSSKHIEALKEREEDDEKTVREKARALAQLIRTSGHVVVHTGAGISTSASIPDFRGPNGVWTLKDQGLQPQIDMEFEEACPTFSHMAIAELLKRGLVKYVISQNVDGLHLRSGVARENLSELHGNIYLETCKTCKHNYLRDFDAAQDADDNHYTGRDCEQPSCQGKLIDSIIDFGEDLPELDLRRAEEHASKSDLALVLGSSLTVTPASTLLKRTLKNGGKICIVNLQGTEYDQKCGNLRFFNKIDGVMQLVMEELQIPVPTYRFESKKIMVGTTTESLMEKEQKIKSSSGPQKKRVSEQQPDSRGRRRVTLFVCGEYGYPCPLIESIEIKNVHQLTSLKLIVKPLVHEAGQSLVFSGLSQGDLLFVDVPDVGEQGAKRLKTSQESYVQTVLPSTESLLSSIELEIRFKPYCNSLPTRVSIDLDPAEGVKEHMFHVTFTPPTSEEQQPSFAPPTLIQSCSKTLDEL